MGLSHLLEKTLSQNGEELCSHSNYLNIIVQLKLYINYIYLNVQYFLFNLKYYSNLKSSTSPLFFVLFMSTCEQHLPEHFLLNLCEVP